MSSSLNSELLNTPQQSSSTNSRPNLPTTRVAMTFPALQGLYDRSCGEVLRLRNRADVRRKRFNDLSHSLAVHSKYVYKLANMVTLFTEGVPLTNSTIPQAIPANLREEIDTPEKLMNHLDALVQALEDNIARMMYGATRQLTLETLEPVTPSVASIELIRTDAEATLADRLNNLSFPPLDVLLSPLAITDPLITHT